MGRFGQAMTGQKLIYNGEPLFPGFDRRSYSKEEKGAACSQAYFSDRLPSPLPRNQVQLSTYAYSIGGNLENLKDFLDEKMAGVFGGLYFLPLYPSTADRGFAPVNYKIVDPELGSWDTIEALAEEYDLCLDFVLNHISSESEEFQDFLAKGDRSVYADMFLQWDKFWPEGDPTEEDKAKMHTFKGEMPVMEVELADGSKKRIWTTFGPKQVDIDTTTSKGWEFVEASVRSLCTRGVKMLRLDAFGYATKKVGSNCFYEEEEASAVLNKLESILKDKGIRLVCEVHTDYSYVHKLAEEGHWGYDFALPLLVQHALHYQTAVNLRHWLGICPRRQITVLDTHDGLGVDDVIGLIDENELEEFRRLACMGLEQGRMTLTHKYFYDPTTTSYVENIQQINMAYYPACQEDDLTYLLARSIQFFCPGIPMVFYVGALAGGNDLERVKSSGLAKDIGRRNFTLQEAREQADVPVVKALNALCRFRNQHPAFQGTIFVPDDVDHNILKIRWENGKAHATLTANLRSRSFSIAYTPAEPMEGKQVEIVRFDAKGISCSPNR